MKWVARVAFAVQGGVRLKASLLGEVGALLGKAPTSPSNYVRACVECVAVTLWRDCMVTMHVVS